MIILRNGILAALALMLPTSLNAQQDITIRPAFVQSEERVPMLVYISDSFRARPELDLLVITYERPRSVWHFDSPREDVNRIHAYLREHSGFGARHMVAIANDKAALRMFVRPVPGLELEKFDLDRTSIRPATHAEMIELLGIGTGSFALYLAESIEERSRTIRQLFGETAVAVETVELIAVFDGGTERTAQRLRSAMRDAPRFAAFDIRYQLEGKRLTATTTIPYDRERLLEFFNMSCSFAEPQQARCVDWQARTQQRPLTGRR